MALQATFVADFSNFQDAVAKAEVSLKSFESGSVKVESQLNRVTNSLSGTRLIQDATVMAEAVERVGGVSKLTEAELARVSKVASEAAEKLVKLGQDVPPGIQKIADETHKVDNVHQSLISTIKDVAVGYLSMATARAAYDFVKKTVEEASALKVLSTQTRIGVEDLQLLQSSMSSFGVGAGELGNGLYTVSRKIAGGDDSVATGLHLMGMSLRDVEGLQGQELFLKIERGLATLQGGLRDTAASDIFGSRLGMAMAGAAEGIDTAMAESRRMNVVMGKDAVDALDKYDDSINKAEKSLGAMAANILGPVADGFNKFVDLAGKAGVASTMWARFLDSFGSGTKHFDELNAKFTESTAKTNENTEATDRSTAAHNAATVALTEQGRAIKFMWALEADAAKDLTAQQRANLDRLKEIGAANAQNAAGVGVTSAQYAKWTEEVKNNEEAHKKLEAQVERVARKGWETAEAMVEADRSAMAISGKLWGEYYEQVTTLGKSAIDRQVADIHRWAAEQEAAFKAQKNYQLLSTSAVADFYDALTKDVAAKLARVGVDQNALTDAATSHSKEGLQQIADAAARTYDIAKQHVGQWSDATIEKFRLTAEAAQDAANRWGASFDGALAPIPAKVDKITDAAKRATDAVSALSATWTVPNLTPAQQRANYEQSQIDASINAQRGFFTMPSIALNTGIDPREWIMNQFPARAGGGPVADGQPYLVGERGPELFVPSAAGSILPNGVGIGRGVTINLGGVYVTQPLGTPENIAAAVGGSLDRRLRAIGTRFGGGA